MSTALDAISAHTREQLKPRPAKYPGTDAPIFVRLLTDQEIDDAKLEAQRYIAKRKANVDIDPEYYDREVQRQIIWHAVLHGEPDDKGERAPVFAADSDVRKLSSVEIDGLWRLYLENQERSSVLRDLTDDQVRDLVESVARNEREVTNELGLLDPASLVRLLVAVLKRLGG